MEILGFDLHPMIRFDGGMKMEGIVPSNKASSIFKPAHSAAHGIAVSAADSRVCSKLN